MTITQEQLIQHISRKGDLAPAEVRRVILLLEESIAGYLSQATPSETVTVKVLRGVSLEAAYIGEHTLNQGLFQNVTASSRLKVRPRVTRYYNRKLNQYSD